MLVALTRTNIARLHEILAKMWWRMRELIYEEKPKPAPRKRVRAATKRKGNLADESFSEGDETYLVSPAACLLFCVYHSVFATFSF